MEQNNVIIKTEEFIKELLKAFNLNADITVEFTAADDGTMDRYVLVRLNGDDLNELVGFHGKNMEAIQTVVSMMLNREFEKDLRVLLEVNDYRERREKYLQNVAQRAAMEVKSTGQDVELPPMKPYERRVVHMALKLEEGIESESIGEGENRRIVIKKTN